MLWASIVIEHCKFVITIRLIPWGYILNWCINYISVQTTGLDHLRAHFHPDRGLYPDSGSILTVVYP